MAVLSIVINWEAHCLPQTIRTLTLLRLLLPLFPLLLFLPFSTFAIRIGFLPCADAAVAVNLCRHLPALFPLQCKLFFASVPRRLQFFGGKVSRLLQSLFLNNTTQLAPSSGVTLCVGKFNIALAIKCKRF